MNEINKLIEADEINCKESLKLFDQFDPSIAAAFDDASNLFSAFSRSFSHGATDDDTQRSISKLAKEGSLTESELREVLNDRKPTKLAENLFRVLTPMKFAPLSPRMDAPWRM